MGERPALSRLEHLTLAHVAVLVVGTTWAFGGQAEWVRPPITWFGTLGVLLTVFALRDPRALRDGRIRSLAWAWPVLAFNLFVLLGCLNPSFREVRFETELNYAHVGGRPGIPSVVRPDLALGALWRFDVLWLAGFNLALIIRQRRALRWLFIVMVVNAAVLAIFGTLQKLAHAKGIFFDAVTTPQVYFFASFVYHNHWGAFMLLMLATCLGLVWHAGRRLSTHDFFHSPAFGGVVVLLLLAVTVPLSGSRSSTILALGLLGVAFVIWLARLIRTRRHHDESIAPPIVGALAAVALAAAAAWMVAGEMIALRLSKTREQLTEMRERGTIGDRAQLYRNTWRMAQAKPWYGWGMGSYPQVFTRFFNTRSPRDKLPIFYNDAHNDWLQALAEHGFVGSALLALAGIIPLRRLRTRHLVSPIPGHLLAGCALVLLYALLEFPLANLAVVLCWWVCFYGAVHYARLQDREGVPARADATY
ncbi:MAG TPA: O-antigen ligase family protein [Opitutaceae bacterium]|nr:O-antigen ligase family protein [Opitutaceae bacterium]